MSTTTQTLSENLDDEVLTVKIHQMKQIQDSHKWMFILRDLASKEQFDPSRYELVGEITIPQDEVYHQSGVTRDQIDKDPELAYQHMLETTLNLAWMFTQNNESHWYPKQPCRSCMIGDVYEFAGRHYVILSSGFVLLSL